MPFPPRFTINKETTIALGPVTASGFVDYAEAINRKLSEGVTAKDNAAIDLIRALGPSVDFSPLGPAAQSSEFKEIWEKLDMGPIPEGPVFFITASQFINRLDAEGPILEMKNYPEDTTPAEVANKELESVVSRPWKPEEHPFIARWLKENERPLSLIKSAWKKKAFFIPCKLVRARDISLSLHRLPDDGNEALIVLPGIGSISKIVELRKALAAHAMLLLGEGRHEEAWKELLDSHHLAVLMTTNGSLIDLVVGLAFDIPIQEAALAFFQDDRIKPEFFKKMIQDLLNLEKYHPPAKAYDLIERYLVLSMIMACNCAGMETAMHLCQNELFTDENKLPEITEFSGRFFSRRLKKAMASIQWDPILKQTNDHFDKVVAALTIPDRALRNAARKQLKADQEALKPVRQAAYKQWVDYLYHNQMEPGWDKQKMQNSAVDVFKYFIADSSIDAIAAVERAEQKWINLTVATALEACKREHGAYPTKLSELAPTYLKEIPKDLFSNQDLQYRRTANGYQLYSVGNDETDDGGKMQISGEKTGDIVIEMPPAPKPAKAE